MSPVQTFPPSAADAMATVRAGLRFLAAADATQMPVQTQAECLQMLEQANAISTAARASILGAFAAGQGAAGRWRTGQGAPLRLPRGMGREGVTGVQVRP